MPALHRQIQNTPMGRANAVLRRIGRPQQAVMIGENAAQSGSVNNSSSDSR